MFKLRNYLSETHIGTLYMIGGILLLLHTLGIIERGINTILIIVSVGLIMYGFFKAGYHQSVPTALQNNRIDEEEKKGE